MHHQLPPKPSRSAKHLHRQLHYSPDELSSLSNRNPSPAKERSSSQTSLHQQQPQHIPPICSTPYDYAYSRPPKQHYPSKNSILPHRVPKRSDASLHSSINPEVDSKQSRHIRQRVRFKLPTDRQPTRTRSKSPTRSLSMPDRQTETCLTVRHRDASPSNLLRRILPRAPTPPCQPTVHILTFSSELVRDNAAFWQLMAHFVPPTTPHLYTITCSNMRPPPPDLGARHSGTHPLVQSHVLSDPRARVAIYRAVQELADYGCRKGGGNVAISASCVAGTHRSVAVAECIGEAVEALDVGVRVRVLHVHRVRRRGDPF